VTSAAIGAEYVAPYLGRMDDAGRGGVESCAEMQEALRGLGSHTRLLVASIREASQIPRLAAKGCDTFTFSPDIAKQMVGDELTVKAAADFEAAAGRMVGGAKRGKIGFNID
jgi:transaldolase